MTHPELIPSARYGVLQQDASVAPEDEIAEQVRRLGYALVDSGIDGAGLEAISNHFDKVRQDYVTRWGREYLEEANEYHTIRALLTHGGVLFRTLAMNSPLHAILSLLIGGRYVLNQQNGVINPPCETYNQGAWHRDLPYQHYVSSSPLAVNALFCIDDFTLDNGATFVIPASHKSENFPSENYLRRHAVQVTAKAGQFILLDCMLFHSGGFNRTTRERRAVNHVFNIPYFKQQINLPSNLVADDLSAQERAMFGLDYQEPSSIEAYLASRIAKKSSY